MPKTATPPAETFAARLLRLRGEAGWSQAEFAALAGVPPSTLCDLERGGKLPGLPTLAALTAALGLSLSAWDGISFAGHADGRRKKKSAKTKNCP